MIVIVMYYAVDNLSFSLWFWPSSWTQWLPKSHCQFMAIWQLFWLKFLLLAIFLWTITMVGIFSIFRFIGAFLLHWNWNWKLGDEKDFLVVRTFPLSTLLYTFLTFGKKHVAKHFKMSHQCQYRRYWGGSRYVVESCFVLHKNQYLFAIENL